MPGPPAWRRAPTGLGGRGGPRGRGAGPGLDQARIDETQRHVAVTLRNDIRADALDPFLGSAGDRQPLADLGGRQVERSLDLAPHERLDDRLHLRVLDPVTLDQVGRHRGEVEGGRDPGGLLRGGRVLRDRPEHRGAEIEAVVERASGPSGSLSHVVGGERECFTRVRAGDVQAVRDPARDAERAGPLHGAHLQRERPLNRSRRGEEPRVPVVVALEVDAPVRQEAAHHLVRLAETGERLGSLPLDPVLRQEREVADREHDLGAAPGELVERRSLLCDQRRVLEDDAADLGAEANAPRPGRGRREEDPHVLVVRLVGAVAGAEAQLVGGVYDLDQLGQRLVGKELNAEVHG